MVTTTLRIHMCEGTGPVKKLARFRWWLKVASKVSSPFLTLNISSFFSNSDIDIICHWFHPATPVKVSSFGSLKHFRKSAKPVAAGSATRCLECPMEKDCEYSAKKGRANKFSLTGKKMIPHVFSPDSLSRPRFPRRHSMAGRYHSWWSTGHRKYHWSSQERTIRHVCVWKCKRCLW